MYYRIRVVDINKPGPIDTWYVIQDRPGKTNSSHEERIDGWLGTTNGIAEYAEGEYDSLEAAVEDIDRDIYLDHDPETGKAYAEEYRDERSIVAVYRDRRSSWKVEDWLIDPIDMERQYPGMTVEQVAEIMTEEAARQDIVLDGDVVERVRELIAKKA